MKKRTIILQALLTVLLPLLIVSCDNTVDPPPVSTQTEKARDYFPLEIGNYWVFETYNINSNFEIDSASKKSIDSLVFTGTQTLQGKSAYIMVRFRDYSPLDTFYFANDGEYGILQYRKQSKDSIPGASDNWYKIADFSQSSWNLYNTTQDNIPMRFNNKDLLAKMTVIVNGSSTLLDSLLLKDKYIKGREFRFKNDTRLFSPYKFGYQGKGDTTVVKDTVINGQTRKDTVKISIDNKWLVDSVQANYTILKVDRFRFTKETGLFMLQEDPVKTNIFALPASTRIPNMEFYSSGRKSILIRYRVTNNL